MDNYRQPLNEDDYLPFDLTSMTDPKRVNLAVRTLERLEIEFGHVFVYGKMYSKFNGDMRSRPVRADQKDWLDVKIIEKFDKQRLTELRDRLLQDVSANLS